MEQTFAIYTFGCKVNQEEGAALAALFAAAGWCEVDYRQAAALYIINTCTVTQVADRKARSLIRHLAAAQPAALIAVTGCYAQRAAAELERIEGVDLLVGLEERARLPQLVAERLATETDAPLQAVGDIQRAQRFQPIGAGGGQKRARAYLKIEDGCEQNCHYCIIPRVRGPVRSLPLAQALSQAARLLAEGHRELVLSGIHIGAYGTDLPPGEDLPALLRALCALPGDFRVRLGSLEPQQIDVPLRELFAAEKKICPHLHIPLQAGCDRTLARMGRHYQTADYAALVADLRRLRPGLAITSDLIVGYPGETAADFQASLDFCAAIGFSQLHVFPYSRRPGTLAADLPEQLPQQQKAACAARLTALAEQLQADYARGFIGQPLEFLAEQSVEIAGQRYLSGHSGNYLPLLLPQIGETNRWLAVIGESWRDGKLFAAWAKGNEAAKANPLWQDAETEI